MSCEVNEVMKYIDKFLENQDLYRGMKNPEKYTRKVLKTIDRAKAFIKKGNVTAAHQSVLHLEKLYKQMNTEALRYQVNQAV